MKRQHELFCEAYLSCFSWQKAYLSIYPDATPEKARRAGYDIYRNNAEVREYIDGRFNEIKEERRISADKYMARLDSIAIGELGDPEDVGTQLNAIKLLLQQLNRNEDKAQGVQEQTIKISLED